MGGGGWDKYAKIAIFEAVLYQLEGDIFFIKRITKSG
jgi:hypothetical protein